MTYCLEKEIDQAYQARNFLKQAACREFIETFAQELAQTFSQGGKVLVAGNGGSLCDATHFAEELTGYYRSPRDALAAIALNDSGHMSCVANDQGYRYVFSRGVEALGRSGDVLLVLTTSGNSQNLVEAVTTAKALGLRTVSMLGKGGGALRGICDLEYLVESLQTSDRIQELHMCILHLVIGQVESLVFSSLGCV